MRGPRDKSRPLTWAVIWAVIAAFLVTSVAPVAARVFDPETFTLDNGMQVVVIPNHRAPIVSHMVWYKVGAADEEPGETGLAHFLEHLMFKGTDTLGPGEFSEIIAANGGTENAFTSMDYTGYFQTVAKDRLEIVMEHEADRMTNLRLTDELVDPERQVVLEERRSRVDNDPGTQLSEAIRAAQFLNHPYRRPVIGWKHEIEALTKENALAFYKRWYAPNNAILIIAGDVTADEVRPLAEKYYGVIPPGDIPERVRVQEPPQRAARTVTIESPRVRQPSLSVSYLAPSYNGEPGERAYALQVLTEILGGGTTSRLYRALVVEQKLAAGAGSYYSPGGLDHSTFGLYASPRPDVPLDQVEAALEAQIERLLADGVTAEEVASAKKRLVASAVYARDNLSTGANVIGRALTGGQTVADVEAWPERIDAVTEEQVEQAARAVLRDESSVTGYLLPKPTS
ncbi:MAG: pitrilysin family protein [Pseudomonadota bacterium]